MLVLKVIVVIIAAVSILISYFVAQYFLGDMTEKGVKVDTIEKIQSTIQDPDPAIFNSEAINPAVEVNIGSES